jgi:transposase-like protein
MYPVVFFDALRVKIREEAVVRNKAIYLALGVLPDGLRDILGLWIENTESSRANSSQVGINTRSLAISSVLQNSIQAELLIDKKDGLSRLEAASHRRRRPNP